MSTQETFYCVGILFMIMSPSTMDTSECGVFNFETSNIVNGTLFVKETTLVNLTFTLVNTNCSNVTYDVIDIFKKDNTEKVFMHQCKILQPCTDRPIVKNISCHCLGSRGPYSLTFIADRTHNTEWKWTAKHRNDSDVIITLNVTYPAHVTLLEIYDTYISNHRLVTVVCTWENGNPPTRAILRDRHNNLLAQSNTSGNISYTFLPAKCLYSGVIRCEADGSVRNKSTTILNTCAPEFVRTATIQTLNIGKNADVTFPFRSHTLNISSCHINQVVENTNHDTKHDLIHFFICTKSKINESDVISENELCLYSVSGEPPDLNITIQIRNLKDIDVGLWYVNITNDEGSDVTYLYVKMSLDSDNTVRIISISAVTILGVAASGVIIVYYFTKGKNIFAKLGRRKNKVPDLLKCIGTDTVEYYQRQSGTYCEIRDTLDNDASDFPFLKPEHLRQVTNEDGFPTTHDHKNSNSSDASTHIHQSKEGNFHHSLDWQLVHEGSKTNNVPEVSSNFKRVTTGKETRKIQPMLQHLKIVQIESNINYVP